MIAILANDHAKIAGLSFKILTTLFRKIHVNLTMQHDKVRAWWHIPRPPSLSPLEADAGAQVFTTEATS